MACVLHAFVSTGLDTGVIRSCIRRVRRSKARTAVAGSQGAELLVALEPHQLVEDVAAGASPPASTSTATTLLATSARPATPLAQPRHPCRGHSLRANPRAHHPQAPSPHPIASRPHHRGSPACRSLRLLRQVPRLHAARRLHPEDHRHRSADWPHPHHQPSAHP